MFLDARERANGQYSKLLPKGGARGPHKRLYVFLGVFFNIFVAEGVARGAHKTPTTSYNLV
jgi:hypothetical protein